jgi:mannose-6-phosphate isomerase-like protein (cupin superfamily)
MSIQPRRRRLLEGKATDRVRIARLNRSAKLKDSNARSNVTVFGDDVSSNVLVAWKRLPAQSPMGAYHFHKKAENILVVLTGTLEAIVGGKRYTVRENEIIYMPEGVPHATGNAGREEVQAIEFYCPSRGEGPDMDSFPAELPPEILDADAISVKDMAP